MAILKIIAHGKKREAKRKVLQYVLDTQKTQDGLSYVTGDFQADEITPKTVFQDFQRVRKMFNKDIRGSRTYLHGTVSFAPGELPPDQVKDFAVDLMEKIYPEHQVLVVAHTDTAHPHAHFVAETVAFTNGKMLHTSKHDLERAKMLCEQMCRERGLTVAQKGHHADGTPLTVGEVTAWEKNKFHQIVKDPKKSYLVTLALAVQHCTNIATDQENFCAMMEHEYGWIVTWKDSKKNIVFTDNEGHRVRDTNLSKTFQMDINKEALVQQLEKNRTQRPRFIRRQKRRSRGR